MRTRKKYLVFRKDREREERRTVGVFSSRKRAESSIRKDSTRLSAPFRDQPSEAAPYLEAGRDCYRLVLRPGEEVSYGLEILVEDEG